jgi:hypothetical protein
VDPATLPGPFVRYEYARRAVCRALSCALLRNGDSAVSAALSAARAVAGAAKGHVWERERKAQEALLHDVVGNPFRPVAVDPAWLRWQGGAVIEMAHDASRDLKIVSVLADALEEAGCRDENWLGHLRGPARTAVTAGPWPCRWAATGRPCARRRKAEARARENPPPSC